MITSAGVGSGLDLEGLITQLVNAERAPTETRLVRRESALTAQLSAFGSFQGALSSFQSSLASLTQLSTFGQRSASSSDEDILTVSASPEAIASSYEIGVTQLARSHSLASGSYGSLVETVGEGELTIRFGNTDYTPPTPGPESYNSFTVNPDRGVANITIDSSNNTLEGVRDAINNADIGVTAVVVNDGSGFRLLLSSEQSGAENSLEISVADSGDGNNLDSVGLSALAFNSSATNLEQTVAAQDATFTVNGLSVNSADNIASGVIEGVDITLTELSGASPVTVTVSEDRAAVRQLVSDFVDSFNNFANVANALTDYNPDTDTAGALQGDFSARSIIGQVRQTLTNAVAGFNGPFTSLSEIGITTQTDGTFALDGSRLDRALDENFDDLVGLFAAVGLPSDNNIGFVGSTDETQVGSYSVDITQLATQGQLIGATAAFPLDIDADNDNLTVTVNGVTSGDISLTQGTYATGAALAAEIQARINGDSTINGAGVAVAVVFNGDHFEITSNEYGSSSSVSISAVDTNTAAELGLSVISGTPGQDVAGTIDGVAALGTGQILTGATGTSAEGLQLLIDGGAIGPRGTVDYSQGIAYQLNALIAGFLEDDGILDSRTDGIQTRLDDIEEQREALDRRIELLEVRFRAQFTALDGLLAQLQSTSSFLTQQLASIPEAGTLVRGNNN
ncbi:flagellar filament capping protein FliD [bacterium SCSIO 12696]|nr:flagellar filament capping protein FliD [bacterium SCSIO 12696]